MSSFLAKQITTKMLINVFFFVVLLIGFDREGIGWFERGVRPITEGGQGQTL